MAPEQMEKLQIGDTVCDCRFKHLRVVELGESRDREGNLLDKSLTLEDGSHCSARHCCDPVPHGEWEHPPGY